MKIGEAIENILLELKAELLKIDADPRCLQNINYILTKKNIFGRKPRMQEEINENFTRNIIGKIHGEIDLLVAKEHFPKVLGEKAKKIVSANIAPNQQPVIMSISEVIEKILHQVNVELKRIGADEKCLGNVRYILCKKNIFGQKTSLNEKFNPRFAQSCFNKFQTEIKKIIAKSHFPKFLEAKVLQIVSTNMQLSQKSIATSRVNDQLVDVFIDTLQTSHMPIDISNQTVIYKSLEPGQLEVINPKTQEIKKINAHGGRVGGAAAAAATARTNQVLVLNSDTFVAAEQLVRAGDKPLVLNLANRFSVGGGVVQGSKAQEEDLMRRSNYYYALTGESISNKVTQGPHVGRHKYNQPISEFGSVFSPDVTVLKDPQYNRIKQPFSVACIAVAGYDLGKHENHPANERKQFVNAAGQFDITLFKEATKKKIRHILDVALVEGYDSLVLGALSCGAFGLRNQPGVTARAVANAYKEALEEPVYQNRFKKIVFAIRDSNPEPLSNFTLFNHYLKTSSPRQQPVVIFSQQSDVVNTATTSTMPVSELENFIRLGINHLPDHIKLKVFKDIEEVSLNSAIREFSEGFEYGDIAMQALQDYLECDDNQFNKIWSEFNRIASEFYCSSSVLRSANERRQPGL